MLFFFFKQMPAYEMRISDWSSDLCSSDLTVGEGTGQHLFDHGVRLVQIVGRRDRLGDLLAVLLLGGIGGRLDDRLEQRAEERRVGKECGSKCRFRWSLYH